jgi:glycosyltransferase involved in cell wall biosynthesis
VTENQVLAGRKAQVFGEIAALLAEVDRERRNLRTLTGPPRSNPAAMLRLERLLMAPSFMDAVKLHSAFRSPIFSIVMATRNRAAWIGEAIASIQAQSFSDWELIIVDDGSTDRTADVIAKLSTDSRIRYFGGPYLGPSATRNCGLRHAKGEFIAYLDSDNLWYPNFLLVAMTVFALDHSIDCAYGAMVTEYHSRRNFPTVWFHQFDRSILLQRNFIDLSTFVHRRSLVDIHGYFDETLTRLLDWDFILRYTRDKSAFRLPVLAARYRVVDDQRISATSEYEPNYRAIKRKWDKESTNSATFPRRVIDFLLRSIQRSTHI